MFFLQSTFEKSVSSRFKKLACRAENIKNNKKKDAILKGSKSLFLILVRAKVYPNFWDTP